ncbi:unnamed protein product [Acanthoscelides obtectus]|nr:unnamed protein product [Acanthoscelides obtectus]CAK1663744.1 Nucleolar complex protein 2 homolog [Acanthoscelides obtectus]
MVIPVKLGNGTNDEDYDSEELSESELMKDSESEEEINGQQQNESNENSDDEANESSNEDIVEKHKKDLEKLKETDPEFYEFLKENDKKLLQFNLSDEEPDSEAEEPEAVPEQVHKPSENLEVASDESDYEDGDKPKNERAITLKMLKQWQSELRTDKSNKTIIIATQAFHAALTTVSSEDEEPSYFKVEGSAVFNGVIQLCVLELGPAIRKFLGLKKGSKQPPHKCKRFVKIKNSLKSYFADILKLLLGVTSTNIQTVLLKHLHYMSNLLVSFPNITKSLVKRLIGLWGTSDDTVRVLAFFCILRITSQQMAILDTVLKSMYMTYVKNTKFVSFKGLPLINFMRRSLVEMYSLDTNVSYSHVFLYIRQLAIHIRNAITANKKENIQAVYNWQFINSLRIWSNLLSATYNKPVMQQLVYPFVQVCIGTLRLVPTAQYYPLRFHVVQVLMDLSKETGVFMPVLPFLLEVLTSYDFNKKHQKVSMKPMHFTCLLRVSKSQLQENGFKDMVIETIYGQILEYMASQSHKISFPDICLICVVQIKKFMKQCKNPNYTRKFKQLLDKVQQNNQFIEKERSSLTVKLTDVKQIEGWESQMLNKGTPLRTYYDSWNKLRTIKKNKQLTNNEELANYNLPTIKKTRKTIDTSKKCEGPVELFPSDSEDEDEETSQKRRRGKRGGKNIKKKYKGNEDGPIEDGGEEDIVEDIQLEDWE